jgi:hypothetical protein
MAYFRTLILVCMCTVQAGTTGITEEFGEDGILLQKPEAGLITIKDYQPFAGDHTIGKSKTFDLYPVRALHCTS